MSRFKSLSRMNISAFLTVLLILILAAGCGGGGSSAEKKQEGEKAAPSQQKAESKAIDKLSLAAASPGGSLYVAGSNLATLVKEKMNVSLSVESTGGTAQNHQLLDSGQVLIGFGMTSDSADGWEGKAKWTGGKQMRSVRSLAPMYPIQLQLIATKGSGISTLSDLKGKRIVLGPAASGHDQRWRNVFSILGIEPKILNVPLGDASDMFRDGRIDALGMISSIPTSTIADLDSTTDVVFVPMTKEEVDKITKEASWAKPATISEGSYKQMKKETLSVESWIYLAANPNLPEDFAYKLLTVLYANQVELQKANKNFAGMKPENIANLNMPLHPGALKYYQEKGVKIPSELKQ